MACRKYGVKALTGWFFSTENWARPKEEVDYLMALFHRFLVRQRQRFVKNGIRVRIIGEREGFPADVRAAMDGIERATAGFDKFDFVCALGYGGRSEIVRAAQKIVDSGISKVDAGVFERYTFLGELGLPAPDFIIRTSGEQRLSGFLPWHGVYSELYFPKFFFPDFTEARFVEALEEYSRRDRRFGNVPVPPGDPASGSSISSNGSSGVPSSSSNGPSSGPPDDPASVPVPGSSCDPSPGSANGPAK
jgi:undecaprenyl diphosphate synthase